MKLLVYYLVILSVAGSVVPYTSDLYGVLLAVTTALLLMYRRSDSDRLPAKQALSEVGLSGLAGFIAHAITLTQTDNARFVFVSCILAGFGGSKTIEYYFKDKFGISLNDKHDKRDQKK